MEREELIERLKGYEWNDVEFKRAQKGVPESAYETVSAFSNTEGGERFALAEHLRECLGRTGQVGDQVGSERTDLFTDQVGRSSRNLVTDQVDAPTPRLVSDQADAPVPNLATDQTTPEAPDLSSAQVRSPSSDLSSAQVEPLTELSTTQWKILGYCDVPRRMTEIMDALGAASRGHFMKHHLDPLIRAGIVAMTNPENPRASNQRYVATDAGADIKARHADGDAGMRGGG